MGRWTTSSSSNGSKVDLKTRIGEGEIGVGWRAGKEKGEDHTGKEKKDDQTATKAPVILARLGLIEPGVKGPEKVAIQAGR